MIISEKSVKDGKFALSEVAKRNSQLLHKDEENKTDWFAGTALSTVQQGQHEGSMEGESSEVNQQRTMVTNSDEEYIFFKNSSSSFEKW